MSKEMSLFGFKRTTHQFVKETYEALMFPKSYPFPMDNSSDKKTIREFLAVSIKDLNLGEGHRKASFDLNKLFDAMNIVIVNPQSELPFEKFNILHYPYGGENICGIAESYSLAKEFSYTPVSSDDNQLSNIPEGQLCEEDRSDTMNKVEFVEDTIFSIFMDHYSTTKEKHSAKTVKDIFTSVIDSYLKLENVYAKTHKDELAELDY